MTVVSESTRDRISQLSGLALMIAILLGAAGVSAITAMRLVMATLICWSKKDEEEAAAALGAALTAAGLGAGLLEAALAVWLEIPSASAISPHRSRTRMSGVRRSIWICASSARSSPAPPRSSGTRAGGGTPKRVGWRRPGDLRARVRVPAGEGQGSPVPPVAAARPSVHTCRGAPRRKVRIAPSPCPPFKGEQP